MHLPPKRSHRRELTRKKGGSGMRYLFDIKADDVTYKVGVDGCASVVLENAAEAIAPTKQLSRPDRMNKSR
jgi:hypothetical protein